MDPETAPFHLTDEQWQILQPLFPPPPPPGSPGRPPADPRAVLEGILWKMITAAPWYQLPYCYPSYQTCKRRVAQWMRNGLMHEILGTLHLDLCQRGGLDPKEAFKDGRLQFVNRFGRKELIVDPALQGTWQLGTALIFVRLIVSRIHLLPGVSPKRAFTL
ncbi:MAG TPA: transposase [Anaerolineales bacterium]|nr:transposase [Anaerolineales bacterium]